MKNQRANPGEQELLSSDARRLLLEKYLRGECTSVAAGESQRGSATTQADPSARPKAREAEPPPQIETSIPASTNDSAKTQSGIRATSNRKSVARRVWNRLLHLLCRFGPGGTTLRALFHRWRGVRIGENVWIGDEVYLDNEFPERIELEDGAMIELRATILAHTHGPGRVVIGKNAFIGAGAIIVTSGNRIIVVGEGSVVMAGSLVTGSIAPYTLYGSDASKPLAKITQPFTGETSYEEFMTTLLPLPR